jgi:SNF2 family DNA or RNA helicase
MGFRVGKINGDVSTKRRFEIDDDFKAGYLDIVIGSPATMAVGYNWGHVDTVVFMSLDYMDSSFIQGYRRAIRGKRTTPCLIYVLEYENSVDQKIFAIVQKKSALAHAVDETQERIQLNPEKARARKVSKETQPIRIKSMSELI